MAGPFDWLSSYLPGGQPPQGGTQFGPDDASGAPTIGPAPQQPSPYYSGPVAGSGDVFGLAGLDYLRGLPSRTQVDQGNKNVDHQQDIDARDAQAALMGKAAELQHSNPQAMPDQLFKMLVMDKDAQGELMKVPAGKHGQVLQDIMQRFQPTPPKITELDPGKTAYANPQKQGEDFQKGPTQPMTPQQMGQGRQPKLVSMRNQFGEVTGQGVLIENADGTFDTVPVGSAAAKQQGQGQPQPGQGQPGWQPQVQPGAGPSAAPIQGTGAGFDQRGAREIRPAQNPTGPTGEVMPRKADMVNAYGLPGMAAGTLGTVTGQGGEPQQAGYQQLQQLRGSLLALHDSSARLKGELKAREALLPPENPWLVSPEAGIRQLIQLHDWVTTSAQKSQADIASPYTSMKTKQEAEKDLRSLQAISDQLGPRDDLITKQQELKQGQGKTGFKDVVNTIPSRQQIGKTVDEAKGALSEAGAKTGVTDPQAAADLQGLSTSDLRRLAEKGGLAPEQLAQIKAEADRRRQMARPSLSRPEIAPAPGAPKSQEKVPRQDGPPDRPQ